MPQSSGKSAGPADCLGLAGLSANCLAGWRATTTLKFQATRKSDLAKKRDETLKSAKEPPAECRCAALLTRAAFA